jgi:hypothetical protein
VRSTELCRRASDCALSWQRDFNASLCIEQKFTCMCSTLPTQNAVAKIPFGKERCAEWEVFASVPIAAVLVPAAAPSFRLAVPKCHLLHVLCLQACFGFEMTVFDRASSRQFPTTMCTRRTLQATNGTSFANTVTRYVRGLANMLHVLVGLAACHDCSLSRTDHNVGTSASANYEAVCAQRTRCVYACGDNHADNRQLQTSRAHSTSAGTLPTRTESSSSAQTTLLS